jgi:hypothetical protein
VCKLGVINQLQQSQEKGKAPVGAGPVSTLAFSACCAGVSCSAFLLCASSLT